MSFLWASFSRFSELLASSLSLGGLAAVRTWEFSYLFRAGCVLCCVPTKVSKCPDELADFTGDCSAALRPSFGGGCVLFASPSHPAGLPVSLAFSAAPGPPLPCRPVPGQRCEMAGVNSCLGGGAFPPILCVGAAGGFPTRAMREAVLCLVLGGAVQANTDWGNLPARSASPSTSKRCSSSSQEDMEIGN